jgi:hypothetical protein
MNTFRTIRESIPNIHLFNRSASKASRRAHTTFEMPTQTALALTEIDKPLTKITLPIPASSELKDNEILIKITAAGREFYDFPSLSHSSTSLS